LSAAPADASAPSPAELLKALQAEAFGRGPAGVKALYAYASGRMRGKVGALDVFRRAFSNTLYAPLLAYPAHQVTEPTIIGDSARSELTLLIDGQAVGYLLGMVREQRGPGGGGWRLSGVVRQGVDL
jgi:hypothetical protein